MGKPSPTVLVLIIEKFILWEDVMVAWDEPIRSNRSEEFEAAAGGPKDGCDPLTSSTADCVVLPKSSPPEATGPDGAWLKALQSPKSPFPLVAVTKTKTNKKKTQTNKQKLVKVRNFLKHTGDMLTICEWKQIRTDLSLHLQVSSPYGHYFFSWILHEC